MRMIKKLLSSRILVSYLLSLVFLLVAAFTLVYNRDNRIWFYLPFSWTHMFLGLTPPMTYLFSIMLDDREYYHIHFNPTKALLAMVVLPMCLLAFLGAYYPQFTNLTVYLPNQITTTFSKDFEKNRIHYAELDDMRAVKLISDGFFYDEPSRGKQAVVFYHPDCPYCAVGMPALLSHMDEQSKEKVLFINLDVKREAAATLATYLGVDSAGTIVYFTEDNGVLTRRIEKLAIDESLGDDSVIVKNTEVIDEVTEILSKPS